jgi:transcriptional regulator with XRE-family HTH domain
VNKKPTKADSPGARLRALRIARGLSQQALAQRVGVTQGAISQFELGNTAGLKHSTLMAIVKELQTNAQYLFKGKNSAVDSAAQEDVTLDERELLYYWRALDDEQRRMVMAMVRAAVREHKPSIADPFVKIALVASKK